MPKRKATDSDGAALKRVHRTRSVTADPGRTCFLTAELLENILIRLSPQEIFLSQRVSRQFRDLVRTSAMIKEKLFICVNGGKDLVWEVDHGADPTLSTAHPGGGIDRSRLPHTLFRKMWRVMPVRLNPSLGLSSLHFRRATSTARRLQYSPEEQVEITSSAIRQRLVTDTGGESWQLQYLSDPPCKVASMRWYWSSKVGSRKIATGRLVRHVQNHDGLTFYDLWRAIWVQKEDLEYWTGSRHQFVQQASFRQVWEKLKAEGGFKALEVFEGEQMEISLGGVVVPTEDEWRAVGEATKPSTQDAGKSTEA
ncbi:hypothetical protein TI39_contig5852g00025 [Zymoseptoria brevis]|uniref:F-box domain-containing protein n=1 Tax=Zymoseptoria brevis TaxID=1047168 RepID=A0A0F4G509_9PEZI|nr:hypothetical protein TI39_contig5852g00025 [Zymoseptoria brevis]